MKIITVPDLHGKDNWKSIDPLEYDKIVFLGDYVDSKGDFSDRVELENLEKIIEFKLHFPSKVELLIGNHDLHYLHFPLYRASSFNSRLQPYFSALFKSNKACFSYAFQLGAHLWTHAGVSKSWFDHHFSTIHSFTASDSWVELGFILNKMEVSHLGELATISPIRGGSNAQGGIMWADKSETINDYLPGLLQYVGHSKVAQITMIGDGTSGIYYLDCLNTEDKFFVLDLNEKG